MTKLGEPAGQKCRRCRVHVTPVGSDICDICANEESRRRCPHCGRENGRENARCGECDSFRELAAITMLHALVTRGGQGKPGEFAKAAFECADAMLEARGKAGAS